MCIETSVIKKCQAFVNVISKLIAEVNFRNLVSNRHLATHFSSSMQLMEASNHLLI